MGLFFSKRRRSSKTPHPWIPPDTPPSWKERFERFEREELLRPDYTAHPDVDKEMKRKFIVQRQGTPEELAADREFARKLASSSTVEFLRRCQEKRRKLNEAAIAQNNRPYRREDTQLWQSLPPVPGPFNGPPMPRLAIRSKAKASRTFWDFFKEFEFGLWGYKQRPYPPEKPMDIQQVLGYKWLDKRYADFVMKSGGWYYKDRLGRTRGPMELVQLKTAWAAGIVDKNTFIWGDDLDEWAPIGMVYGLESCVATPDMKMAAAGSNLVHKMAKGISLWTPKKGHEKKSYKQLQDEGIEKKEREKAVMRLNGGIWPGERAPSHSLFLWASGSELTTLLEDSHKYMPDKFIPYDTRKRLAQEIPGLRPWEVLNVERLMEFVTYGGRWYRKDLGSYTTRADYEKEWFKEFKEKWDGLYDDVQTVFAKTNKEEFITNLKRIQDKNK